MDTEFVLIFGSGLTMGLTALLVVSLAVRAFKRTASRTVDVEAIYADMDETKRSLIEGAAAEGMDRTAQRRLGALYAVSAAVVCALALRLALTLRFDWKTALLVLLITWVLIVTVPLVTLTLRRQHRLAVLEIASILQLIARTDEAETWEITCTKPVLGGDLFGPEEQDWLVLRLTRAEIAPITLRIYGHITVADAGLERTVRKTALRELRLQGWFVDERSSTDVEFMRDWTLRDHSYIDIASTLIWLVQALSLPVGSVRLKRVESTAA